MKIDKEKILSILNQYTFLIESYSITKDIDEPNFQILEIKIKFKNETKLESIDKIQRLKNIKKRKYKYQWMKKDNSLIFRWDNAPHHPFLNNFPFHWHIGDNNSIEPSQEVFLEDILLFISKYHNS